MSYDNRPTPMESAQSGKTNRTLLWAVAGIVIVAIVAAVALSMNRSNNLVTDRQATLSAQAAQSQADAGAQAAGANAQAANANATQAQANAQAAQANADAQKSANDNAASSSGDMAPPAQSSQSGQ